MRFLPKCWHTGCQHLICSADAPIATGGRMARNLVGALLTTGSDIARPVVLTGTAAGGLLRARRLKPRYGFVSSAGLSRAALCSSPPTHERNARGRGGWRLVEGGEAPGGRR